MSQNVQWERISERSAEILRFVAVPISLGYSHAEIGRAITHSTTEMTHLRAVTSTMTTRRVASLMRELRADILRSVTPEP